MSIIDKFEIKMSKIMNYIANKLDSSPHLIAIRRGMMGLIPILLLGGISIIINKLFKGCASNGIFLSNYLYGSELIRIILKGSIGLIGLYAGVIVSYFLSREYSIKSIECVLMTVFAILITSVRYNESKIVDNSMLGKKGLISSIIIAIIVVEIYKKIRKIRLNYKNKYIPEFIKDSIETMFATIMVGTLFIFLRGIVGIYFKGMILPEIVLDIATPIINSLDNLYIVTIIVFIRLVFWYFGIHSGVVMPLIAPILVIYVSENILSMNLEMQTTHFVSMGVFSSVINFTGAGVTIGLVLAMLISKNKRYKKIGKKALKMSFFGVNEPLIFGVPIVLNRIFAIPFLIGGTFLGVLPVYLIKSGFLQGPIFDVTHLPIFFEGFLISLDYKIILVQIIQIALSFIIYFPFFKIMEINDDSTNNIKT